MTEEDLSPLLQSAVRELTELTAQTVVEYEDHMNTARKVVVAYGKFIYHLHPVLESLCRVVIETPPASDLPPTHYYALTNSDVPAIYCAQKGRMIPTVLKSDVPRSLISVHVHFDSRQRLQSDSNSLFSIWYEKPQDPAVSVRHFRDDHIIKAFPSILNSLAYLKDQLRSKNQEMTAWEAMRDELFAN